jgi:putative flippase GtrA
MNNKEYAFIVPAYNPDEILLEVVKNIQLESENKIFIIDDGSNELSHNIFEQLKSDEYNNIIFIKHAINMGKGAALKTVFNHILTQYENIEGVVTLDSDGQHSIEDCMKVLDELKKDDKAFVLGHRTFSKDIPLKSYVGNNISKFIYKLVLGRGFQDTQTGLRGVSKEFMKKCLTIKSNRFEFETEQLVIATNQINDVTIIEIPIETIYIENNKASSFRPLTDSFKIYFVLFRYGLSSVLTSIVDFIVFLFILQFGISVFNSNLISRTAATFVQFFLLKKFVFNSKSGLKTFILFYVYVMVMGSFSAWIQIAITEQFGTSIIMSKTLTEIFLFFVNFAFLRSFIFNKKGV